MFIPWLCKTSYLNPDVLGSKGGTIGFIIEVAVVDVVQEVLAKLGVLLIASNTMFPGLGVNCVLTYSPITSATTSLVSLTDMASAPLLIVWTNRSTLLVLA